jgi:hypothetical protein
LFEVKNNVPSSIDEIQKSSLNFMVYPNPSQGVINTNKIGNYTILNGLGQTIMKANNSNQLDISLLPAGIYFIQNELKQTQKIILQK